MLRTDFILSQKSKLRSRGLGNYPSLRVRRVQKLLPRSSGALYDTLLPCPDRAYSLFHSEGTQSLWRDERFALGLGQGAPPSVDSGVPMRGPEVALCRNH